MKQYGIDRNGADCKDIRPHLKAIDSLFEIVFNFDREEYVIYFNGSLFQSVPWKELDKSTIERIRYMYWLNLNGDPVKKMDETNKKVELSKQKDREDLNGELAKDLHKAILKAGY